MSKSILTSCVLVVFCSCIVEEVAASNFLLESEISAQAGYDDNISFTSSDDESTSMLVIKPKLRLTYKDSNWDTTANANISGTTYSSGVRSQIASYLDLGTAYKDRLNTYAITTAYQKSSNRSADIDEDIIGLTSEEFDRTVFSLTPKYTRALTERLSLSAAYSYFNVASSPDTAALLPYETRTATGSIYYKLSQKDELSLDVSATDYTSKDNISEYDMLTANLGIMHDFSEMISGKISVGTNSANFTTRSSAGSIFDGSNVTGPQAVETESSGGVYEVVFDAKWVELQVSRSNSASSVGGLDKTDRIHAKFRVQLTSLVGMSLLLTRTEFEELNVNVVGSSREVMMIVPAVNVTLARDLTLRAEYQRIDQDQNDASLVQKETSKNKFFVTIKYNFPSI